MFQLGNEESQNNELVGFGFDKGCRGEMVVAGGNHQMREHLLQQADIERMVRVTIAIVMVAVAMTGKLGLEREAFGIAAVVVMMGYNGMQHDNRTCHRNHYLCHQMFHTFDFTSLGETIPSD